MSENEKYAKIANRVLLGLVMLVPGLLKVFMMGPDAIVGMLTELGFPAAAFFAWVLIIGEIASGIAILANWKLEYVVAIPVIILVVAAFTAHIGSIPNLILHIAAASNYVLVGIQAKK